MKRLALLTLSLVASSVAYADIAVQISFKNNDQEVTSDFMRLTPENPSALFTYKETKEDQLVSEHTIKVVLKEEEPYRFDVLEIVEGNEILVSQPEIMLNELSSGSITVQNDNEGFTLTIERVE